MDISGEELPITSFFARAGNSKKKENLLPTRAAGKRKRDGLEPEANLRVIKKGKGKMSLKSTTALDRATLKKPAHMYGTSRASTSRGKQPVDENSRASRPRALPSPEILDLTTPSPERKTDAGPSKRRKVEKGALCDHSLALEKHTHVVGQTFPTPPPSDQLMKTDPRKELMVLATSSSEPRHQLSTIGALPTPETSVARPINRLRPSHLSKVAFSCAPASPLASRKGVIVMQPPSNPPLSSSPSDERTSAHDDVALGRGHVDVAQVLLDVAPKGRDNVAALFAAQEGIMDDDPFAAPAAEIIVPPSQPPNLQYSPVSLSPSSPTADTKTSTKASPIFVVPLLPDHVLQSHTTEAIDTSLSPSRSIVESSQSQLPLLSAHSPRRVICLSQSIVPSSQSQVLLPFMDSSRRLERLVSPSIENNRRIYLGEGSQIVGSSQSQIEKELSLSMGASQIGLFALPPAASSVSQGAYNRDAGNEADSSISLPETMLPESIPRTPPNKRASRWRSLHIGSSPLSSASHSSVVPKPSHEDKDIFNEGQLPMIEDDHAGDATVRPEVEKVRSRHVHRAFASRPASAKDKHVDDSGTESESESAVAKFELSLKQRKDHRVLAQNLAPRVEAQMEGKHSLGGTIENSLVFEPASRSSPRRAKSYATPSQPLSEDDTQALYLAGAPLSPSDYSLRTVATDESTQSIPPAVRDFIDMFDDDDDGSYPRDFPMDLRC